MLHVLSGHCFAIVGSRHFVVAIVLPINHTDFRPAIREAYPRGLPADCVIYEQSFSLRNSTEVNCNTMSCAQLSRFSLYTACSSVAWALQAPGVVVGNDHSRSQEVAH